MRTSKAFMHASSERRAKKKKKKKKKKGQRIYVYIQISAGPTLCTDSALRALLTEATTASKEPRRMASRAISVFSYSNIVQ